MTSNHLMLIASLLHRGDLQPSEQRDLCKQIQKLVPVIHRMELQLDDIVSSSRDEDTRIVRRMRPSLRLVRS